jgi:hypothetical protein
MNLLSYERNKRFVKRKIQSYSKEKLWSVLENMTTSIYQKIIDANLDGELETILVKLLRYNMSPVVEVPVRQFLRDYLIVRDEFWSQFGKSNSFDVAFEQYYQYSKNKCSLIDKLLENLNFTLNYEPLKDDLALIMKEGLTF